MVTSGQTRPRCQALWFLVTLSCVEGTEDSSYLFSLFRNYLDVLYEAPRSIRPFQESKGQAPRVVVVMMMMMITTAACYQQQWVVPANHGKKDLGGRGVGGGDCGQLRCDT